MHPDILNEGKLDTFYALRLLGFDTFYALRLVSPDGFIDPPAYATDEPNPSCVLGVLWERDLYHHRIVKRPTATEIMVFVATQMFHKQGSLSDIRYEIVRCTVPHKPDHSVELV